jgi:ATP-binding cassette subfamily F protein 3
MLLRAEGVAKSFGPNQVLSSVDLQIDKGERIGLVGRNGAGKTTLIRILMGAMRPDVGDIRLRTEKIGYLPQIPPIEPGATVLETIQTPDTRQLALLERLSELETKMATAGTSDELEKVSAEYTMLQGEYGARAAAGADYRIRDALSKVGLPDGKLGSKVSELSGGEKTKVFLARVLASVRDADILFLDEPTSHLDIETVEWLENYLRGTGSAIVIISHDRYFLDNVASRILELEEGNIKSYSGNYSEFIEKKRMEVERQVIAKEKNRTERARQAKIAEEFHRRAWFSSTHKTRLKMLDRMETVKGPVEHKSIRVRIESSGKHGREFVLARALRVTRGDNVILDGADLAVEAGDKLGIIGPNGSGKTTLLLTLLGELPFEGELWVAPGAETGYFAQGHDALDDEKSAESHLLGIFGHGEHRKSRELLARFLITGKDADRPVSTLSGGERARVALAMLIAQKKNLLILDEPTNYLDIPSRHAVEGALADYSGSLIVVTHDRYFLDSVCNKVGVLKDGKLDVYGCTYSQLKDARGRRDGQKREENEHVVVSKFKDWATGRLYSPGETIMLQGDDYEKFSWALETGRLKRARDIEKRGKK